MLPEELKQMKHEFPIIDFYYDDEYQYTLNSYEELDHIRLQSLKLDVAEKVSFKSGDKELRFNEYSVPVTNWDRVFYGNNVNDISNILRLAHQKRKLKENA